MSNTFNYAFIDSQNLHRGIKSLGWEVDYRKFRLYLTNKFDVTKAFIFIGYVPTNQTLYTMLQKAGFIVVFKPTVTYRDCGQEIVKGNVDAELVLHSAAIEYQNYDKAVIVTNDGDFACLLKYLKEKNKLEKVLAPHSRYSKLFKPYTGFILTLDKLQDQLEL